MSFWADVYSRMAAAKKLHADEVSSTNFTYLMCRCKDTKSFRFDSR